MKSKFISTGLPVKGNKKRAEAMLLKARREFNPYNLLENANIPFSDFLTKWLKGRAASLGAATYTTYAYDVKNYIFPYFLDHAISVVNVTPKIRRASISMNCRTMVLLQKSCCSSMRRSQPA